MTLGNLMWLGSAILAVALCGLVIWKHRRPARGKLASERDGGSRSERAPRASVLHIGGRRFRAVTVTSLEHDLWFQARARRAGLSGIPKDDEETAEEYAHRALAKLCEAPEALELVGALIVPAELGKSDWHPGVARDTARFLARLTDPDDKLEVRRLLLTLIVPFLESGLASLRSSASSSDRHAAAESDAGAREPATVMANGAPL